MLNNIYSTPLHGVELFLCEQLFNESSRQLPYSLLIQYGSISEPSTKALWELQDAGANYSTHLALFRASADSYVLSVDCEGKGKFAIGPGSITIDWEDGGTSAAHYFQTLAISLWLELQGVVCIHANAVKVGNKTVAFIAPSGMGKSTISAYMQQQGFAWLTDDMLALHQTVSEQTWVVYPSWPKARMWPDAIESVGVSGNDKLSKVHKRFAKLELELPDNDAYSGTKLDAIYILSRSGAQLASLKQNTRLLAPSGSYLSEPTSNIALSDISSSTALMALLQNSILGNAYSSLALEQARFSQLSELVSNVPIKQLHYPSGLSNLNHVCKLVLEDLQYLEPS
ncbi:hypothetical protein ACFO4O_11735 [Glaciecola siphonariae]|uniref:HPr kinase n=1 Tax=Glaciecola siphonariae TaxID=521012 RepID=A0ABV9LZH0_9ALTE